MNITSCACGRSWTHCRVCGSKNVYRLITESEIQSAMNGRQIDVFRCKKCMFSSSELDDCQAVKPKESPKFRTEEQIAQLVETPEQMRRRFNEEGKSPQELVDALNRAGYKATLNTNLNTKPEETPVEDKKEPLPEESKETVPPISVDEILNTKGKKPIL